MITNVKGVTPVNQNYETRERQAQQALSRAKGDENKAAVYEPQKKPATSNATYSRQATQNVDPSEVNRLIEEARKSHQGLRDLIQKLILKQGKNQLGQLADKNSLSIDEDGRLKAEQALAEDGEWGVKAVSDRIVDFAMALAGGDPAKGAELKEAVIKGFKDAERSFGGALPEICYKTFDEAIRKLDEWINSGEDTLE